MVQLGTAQSSRWTGWSVLGWCVPTLCAFAAFLASSPIDRRIAFWPHRSLAEIFGGWFLFVTPIFSTIAIVKFTGYVRGNATKTLKFSLLFVIAVTVLVNLFVLFGLFAAAEF
jgi:hypothetical protein